MMRKKKYVLAILAAALIAAVIAFPFAWRNGALAWAKSSARRPFKDFTAQERRVMNAVPTLIVLPEVKLNARDIETVEMGSYLVTIPRPDSREVGGKGHPNSLTLTYPHFQASFLHGPVSLLEADMFAPMLGFDDYFAQR